MKINLKEHEEKPCYIAPCPECKTKLEIFRWQIHKGPFPGTVFCGGCWSEISLEDERET